MPVLDFKIKVLSPAKSHMSARSIAALRKASSKSLAPAKSQMQTAWIYLIQRVRNFATLPKGWDSYDAAPPSAVAIRNTLAFLNVLRSLSIYPAWVEPTSDDSIMLEVRVGNVLEEWDFYSDGDVAVLHELPSGTTECRMVKPAAWEMTAQLIAPAHAHR